MGADNAHYRPFLIISMMSALPKTDGAPAKLISVILVRQGMKDKFLEWSGRVERRTGIYQSRGDSAAER